MRCFAYAIGFCWPLPPAAGCGLRGDAAELGEGGSLRIRSALLPTVTRNCSASSVPTPWISTRRGGGLHQCLEPPAEGLDLVAEGLPAA